MRTRPDGEPLHPALAILEEQEARQRIRDAAPDLLASLEEILFASSDAVRVEDAGISDRAMKAWAKARGRRLPGKR